MQAFIWGWRIPTAGVPEDVSGACFLGGHQDTCSDREPFSGKSIAWRLGWVLQIALG